MEREINVKSLLIAAITFLFLYVVLYFLCQLIIEPQTHLEAIVFPFVILAIAAVVIIVLKLIYEVFIYPIICYFFPPKER